MKDEFPRQIFEIYTDIKFHENPSRVSRDVPFGQPDNWDITKLIVGCLNFTKAPQDT